jgi:hypothetical protein
MNAVGLSFRPWGRSESAPEPLNGRTRDIFAKKAANIFGDLHRRLLDNTLSETEVALIFVHYLYGAVSTAFPDAKPSSALGLLADLAEGYLSSADVMCALNAPAPPEDTSIGRVVRGIEMVGRRDGETILAALSDTTAGNAPEHTIVASVGLNQTDQSDAKGEFP